MSSRSLLLSMLCLAFTSSNLIADSCESLDLQQRNVVEKVAKNVESVFGQEVGRSVGETLAATGDAEQACACAASRLGIRYGIEKFVQDMAMILRQRFGTDVYRRMILDPFRALNAHAGDFFRKYWSGTLMDKESFRWSVVEKLYEEGSLNTSFGHQIYKGAVKILSPLIYNPANVKTIRQQRARIGGKINPDNVRVETHEVSAMPSVSGMSFPQLSAQSVISLLHMNIAMARKGIDFVVNTGEGGPGFHLAILNGDRAALKDLTIEHALANKLVEPGSINQARIEAMIDRFFAQRDEAFRDFKPEDISRAKIVAQFGSALNGIRTADYHIDYKKLSEIGRHPNVKMVQFKLKQAAKRGSKVKKDKIDLLTAALRDINPKEDIKSPEVSPDMSTVEDVAIMVRSARAVTGKPVSLKFGVGDVKDTFEFIKGLKELDGLPDHIQIDGAGADYSPGSGAAGVQADTSLNSRPSVMAVDAILKKLGVRDLVFLEVSGDVLLPNEGVEMLALGADGISAARLWMGMGLACAKVKDCASGNCPYGIAAKTNSMFAFALDPAKIGSKGAAAGTAWYEAYTQAIGETSAKDWRTFRATEGMAAGATHVRKFNGSDFVRLEEIYDRVAVERELQAVMTRQEIGRFVYGEG